jgi:hypothetical protein
MVHVPIVPQIAAALLLVVAGPAAAQGFTTNLLRTYGDFVLEGHAPRLADFNRDGKLDAAVLNPAVDSVLVRLGDGFGNLGPVTRLATGAGAADLAVGDLNVDGILDLVITNGTAQTVSVYPGIGNGQFFHKFDYAVPNAPEAVAIGDVTGDGRPDVVTANHSTNTITVLTGNGTGTGLTGASDTFPTGAGPASLALGDVDSNGLTDIVAANSNASTVSVYKALATGGFAAKVDYTTASNPLFVRLGDVDNDGDLDLVTVSGFPGILSTLLNNGAGVFPSHDDLPISNNCPAFELGDLDGDAIPDAALGVDQVTVLRGSGFGTFFSPTTYVTNASGTHGLALGDLDGDGFLDVFVAANRAVALLAAPSPFGPHQDFAVGAQPRDVTVGDLNGDALPDLVSANGGSANVSVLINAGAGIFPNHVEYATPSYPSVVRVGDAGQDNRPEIFVGTFSPFVSDTNRVYVLPNLGDGTFGGRSAFDPVLDGIGGLGLGDVNNDGHLDFVDTRWNGGVVHAFFGNGNGAFFVGSPIATLSTPGNPVIVDVNADTKVDLLVPRYNTNAVAYMQGLGNGNFGAPYNAVTGGTGTLETAAADLDRDGIVDVAALDAGSHSISLFKGANLASLGTADRRSLLGATSGLALADVNRDGIVDIVFGNDAVGTLFGQGTGTIGTSIKPFSGAVAPSPPIGEKYGLALGDLDRNGTLDAVVAGSAANAVSVLHGLQQSRTALTVSPNPAPVNTTLTFTATVTSAWPDSSRPTGTVRFFDGFTLLGTANLVNGVASFIHDASYPWERSFRAEYRGDFRFHGSFSPAVPQTTYPPNVGIAPPALPARLALAPLSNPTSGAVRFRVDLPEDVPADLSLLDVRGRVLATSTIGASGVVELSPSRRLPPGVYLVRVLQHGQSQTARVVVL